MRSWVSLLLKTDITMSDASRVVWEVLMIMRSIHDSSSVLIFFLSGKRRLGFDNLFFLTFTLLNVLCLFIIISCIWATLAIRNFYFRRLDGYFLIRVILIFYNNLLVFLSTGQHQFPGKLIILGFRDVSPFFELLHSISIAECVVGILT